MKKILCMILALALFLPAAAALAESKATPSVCIVVAGTLGDRSFYDSANEGLERLKADFGTETAVLECGEDGSLYESYLYDAAESYDIIAAVGWQFFDALADENGVLAAHPDKKFLFIDNALDVIPENLMCITYAQNEGSFLAGYIAAKLSSNGMIGVVGGEDAATINDFIVGYEAGAQYARDDAKVEKQYANDYEDPAKGKECALALYNLGCEVVFAVAGKTGEGVFEAAKEMDRLAVGVDGDQKYIDPDRIICSMVKRVGQSIYDVAADPDAYFKGGTVWNADMETGYIDVVYGTEDMPQQVSDALKEEVKDLKAKIISGDIVVPTTLGGVE